MFRVWYWVFRARCSWYSECRSNVFETPKTKHVWKPWRQDAEKWPFIWDQTALLENTDVFLSCLVYRVWCFGSIAPAFRIPRAARPKHQIRNTIHQGQSARNTKHQTRHTTFSSVAPDTPHSSIQIHPDWGIRRRPLWYRRP